MEAGNVPSLKHPWDLPSRPVPTGEPSLPFPKAAVLLHSGGVPEVACPHTSTFLIPAAKSRWCPPTRFSVPLCSKHLERAVSDSAPAAPQERFPIWLPCPHPGVLTKVAYGPLARSDGQSPVLRGNLTSPSLPANLVISDCRLYPASGGSLLTTFLRSLVQAPVPHAWPTDESLDDYGSLPWVSWLLPLLP